MVKLSVENNYFYYEVAGFKYPEIHKTSVTIVQSTSTGYKVKFNNIIQEPGLIEFDDIVDEGGNKFTSQDEFKTWYTSNTGKSSPSDGGGGNEKEKYIVVTSDNYNISLNQLNSGIDFIVAVSLNENWTINLPASSSISDDSHIYKTRIVIVGEGNESLSIKITGGETFTKGMTTIKLYRNVNDDVIVGALNNISLGLSGWQREGDNKVICSATRNTNLPINAPSFTTIPFQSEDRKTNETILNWNLSNPNYIESLIRQDTRIDYKISFLSTNPGGTWTAESVITVDRKQTNGTFIAEQIEFSKSYTGNFFGENQLITGYSDTVLNAGDRVRLEYKEFGLSGSLTGVGLSVSSRV